MLAWILCVLFFVLNVYLLYMHLREDKLFEEMSVIGRGNVSTPVFDDTVVVRHKREDFALSRVELLSLSREEIMEGYVREHRCHVCNCVLRYCAYHGPNDKCALCASKEVN